MKDGFIRVAAGTPKIRVADCDYNAGQVVALAKQADEQNVRLLCLPELVLSAYTCCDLFLQDTLLRGALDALRRVLRETRELETVLVLGLPLQAAGKLYNCAAVCHRGELLGLVPKRFLPNYGEFYEARLFTPSSGENKSYSLDGRQVPFGPRLLFCCEEMEDFCFGVEICEDLWSCAPPSVGHCAAGALMICNLSASDETVGKADYRRALVGGQSARLCCGYLYADAGEGESTTDLVFAGHNLIAENGAVLAESERFTTGLVISEVDVSRLAYERRRLTTFPARQDEGYLRIPFSLPLHETTLTRPVSPFPFIPQDPAALHANCEDILRLQSAGLCQRLLHTGAKCAVLGLSGGLDSALALLVAVRAADWMGVPRAFVRAVTMPCFGTSARTLQNAHALCESLGVPLREIPITQAVRRHFADIGQDEERRDVTYENAQARERTQVLMDLANQQGGLVIGTGDLSELALGWATYNGDHMSMYAVNASVPKTLVRHLVAHEAARIGGRAGEVLRDILDTPVSPELLPGGGEGIVQRTEELVGPYELHDFFLYYAIRWGFAPQKVLRLACRAFKEKYPRETILRWLKEFYRRFFAQQFKRSCLPDAPKVGSVTLSPRGDWRMPSDASARLWLSQLENM
ncbi:NAD(+) synthase [Harryflintia acetispora]|uniref:Glutamine-dependent NAD(+) synthetase n=1 Tax=Harryflintia acetispora TaxID=1849041 RepID=A0A9X8Y919_9FIRM|nr:NAD(+) synthase [Harryflintia acetispora]TCL44520.1 NAD+ synthase (glutamine-hydrolysing) [Harryflintia acetispora]